MPNILIKRIYEKAEKTDGYRILIDRLWPRGVKKERAQIDEWIKDVAPSVTLRKWFDHDAEKWEEFTARYTTELLHNKTTHSLLKLVKENQTITLLYAAHDEQHNHALVLQGFLNKKLAIN